MPKPELLISVLLKAPARLIIFSVSLVVSVALYTYAIDYYQDENDLIRLLTRIFFPRQTYTFYSDTSDKKTASVYAQIAKAAEMEGQKYGIKINRKGTTGALENAFGAMNHEETFALIQDDTFLSAEILKTRVKTITPLYMERLHVLFRCDRRSQPRYNCKCSRILTADNACLANNLRVALRNGRVGAGHPGSSARLVLPYLLKHFGIGYRKTAELEANSIHSMLRELKKYNDRKIDFAFFIVGNNEEIPKIVKSNEQINLIGVDPAEVPAINRKFNQQLKVTEFDRSYTGGSSLPTVGAYALLVGSSDLTNREIAAFLTVLTDVSKQDKFKLIFNSPPIVLDDIREAYKTRHASNKWNFFRILMVFLLSVGTSTGIIITLIIWVWSEIKQTLYYHEIMNVYRATLYEKKIVKTGLKKRDVFAQHANYFIRGMKQLLAIGRRVREDYNTGGMTISHHRYLLENLNHIYSWFQDKLAQHLTSCEPETQRHKEYRKDICARIKKWHSKGFIRSEQFEFLMNFLCRGHRQKK